MERDEQNLQKSFALACRILADYVGYPLDHVNFGRPEGGGDLKEYERPPWQRWQEYIAERVSGEPVCRVCGCTQYNACPGGCFWVEDDLCSRCAEAQISEALPNAAGIDKKGA